MDDVNADVKDESKNDDDDVKLKQESPITKSSPSKAKAKKQGQALVKVEASPAKPEVSAKVVEIDPTKPVGEPKRFLCNEEPSVLGGSTGPR